MKPDPQLDSGSAHEDYPNHPRLGVGAVIFKENRVLLVLRSNPPAQHQWAIPGGRVELGETLKAAAEREVLEETRIRIRAGKPIYTFDAIDRDDAGRVRYHYVIVDLDAEYISGEPIPDDDARDARWISAEDIQKLPVNRVTRRLLSEIYRFG
jgi:8-oxo-dGTP diphosphatase